MRNPPRILVVDDNPTNVEILRVRLSAQGYEVVTAADGEEALTQARALDPDLVLLDVMMPKLDGISVLKELKQDAKLKFVPVIMVTAKADPRDVVQGLEAGGDDYLTKPFEQAALVARVRSLLRIKDLHDTVQQQAAKLKEQTAELSTWNQELEARVAAQLGEIDRIGRLQRFLAPQVARLIASGDAAETMLASHRREVTVVFCDLRGFTAFTERSEPEEVMVVLREYHESLGELIFRYEGTLDRFAGDGIMIVFNDPIQCADHTEPRGAARARHARAGHQAVGAMAAQGPPARLRRRHRVGLRDARPDRLRAAPRIHRDRQRHQSRLAAVRRGAPGPDRDRPARLQRDRALRRGGADRRPEALKGFTDPIAAYEIVSWRGELPAPAGRHREGAVTVLRATDPCRVRAIASTVPPPLRPGRRAPKSRPTA